MQHKYIRYFVLLLFAYLFVVGIYISHYVEQKTELPLLAKKPFISVLVTSYNYEKYIKQVLDSILAQTYKKYEVIIVDDGSKDSSVAIINEYVNKYKNFHLYQHEEGINKGLPASFRLGVEKAKGEYVAVLESDDYWAPDNLLERVKMINKHPDAVIISNNIIPFGDDFISVQKGKYSVMSIHQELKEANNITAEDNLFNVVTTFSGVIIKREILLRLDYDTPIPAFLDLYLYRQIFAKYPLYYIKRPLTYWRRHFNNYNAPQNQSTNGKNSEKFLNKLKEVIEKQKNAF